MYVNTLSIKTSTDGTKQVKTLNWYVTRGFLGAFFMAIAILTFGMTGTYLVKVLDYVSQGIPFITFLKFTVYILPIILTFTVPWAVMVAVMLVFGRLSADNEITAMRACGVSILQITSPILVITVLLSAICLFLQVEVGPPLLGQSRDMMKIAAINQPMSMFEPGKSVSYDNTLIYVDDKDGKEGLRGVELYVLSGVNEWSQNISSDYGKVVVDKEKQIMTIKLFDCLVTDKQQGGNDGIDRFFAQELNFSFHYGKAENEKRISIKPKYMNLKDLMGRIRLTKELNKDTTDLEIELNQRFAFALSPIAFLLLGLPLAIRTSRRETSVGLFLSVILAGIFFLSIILCESLESFPKLYPQYLLWLPNIVFQLLGAYMTYRISRK